MQVGNYNITMQAGMTFSALSQYFEKLEKTSSRLALIDILCDLFKEVKKEEIQKIKDFILDSVK